MKITPKELRQIIKEECGRTLNELEHDERDDLEQDMYPGADERGDPDNWDHFYDDDDELSFEDKNRFVEAYNVVEKAVESGQLPESVEDAIFDMLGKLGINL